MSEKEPQFEKTLGTSQNPLELSEKEYEILITQGKEFPDMAKIDLVTEIMTNPNIADKREVFIKVGDEIHRLNLEEIHDALNPRE